MKALDPANSTRIHVHRYLATVYENGLPVRKIKEDVVFQIQDNYLEHVDGPEPDEAERATGLNACLVPSDGPAVLQGPAPELELLVE